MRGRGLLRRIPREEVVAKRIREFVPPGGRLLDVGCGDGFMVGAMNEAGYESHGLDISDVAIEAAHKLGRPSVRKGTIHRAPYPPEHFDVMLMMSYLEHEHHPTRTMERVRELLKPGGHVFVKVPHYGSWNRLFLAKHWSGYFFPQHLFYFTPKTIARLFEKCGLEVVRNKWIDHVPVSDVLWATAKRPG
jgi:2-polyprenyl-3-methyl-5-hydroxy-6-metoxy-1,4-benzoquinol methylase